MVVPTRSQNSSWHSLWDLRGTQAPQLRQSNNTLVGKDRVADSQKIITVLTKLEQRMQKLEEQGNKQPQQTQFQARAKQPKQKPI